MKKKNLKIFKNIPTLKTKRLTLRKMEYEDLGDVYEYTSDPKVSEFLMWYPHKTIEYTKSYLKYILKLYKKGKFYDFGIEFNNKIIGTVGFSSISVRDSGAQIGYVLNSRFWGQGIASEAVEEILRFGFFTLSLERIEAFFLPKNERSRKVLIKSGLKSDEKRSKRMLIKGEHYDVECFSITKEEYLKGINNN